MWPCFDTYFREGGVEANCAVTEGWNTAIDEKLQGNVSAFFETKGDTFGTAYSGTFNA